MSTRTPADRRWVAILFLAFAAALAASWLRWADPVIDTGREMDQPVRLMQGARLYADVGHIYGPLSPYLHALAYRVFRPSLTVLYVDGILSAAIVLALVYTLSRRVLDEHAAGVATLLVMWLCAFKPAGNFILPYSFNALHGTLLGLATLVIAASALRSSSRGRLAWAGVAAGVTLLAKTESGIAAVSAGVAAAWLSRQHTRGFVGGAAVVLACALGVAGLGYAPIAARVGWRTIAFDSWLLPIHLPPPIVFFNARLAGFDRPLASIGSMLLATVKLGVIAAIVWGIACLAAGPSRARARARVVLAASLALTVLLALTTGLDGDRGPFLAMPVVLVGLLVWLASRSVSDDERTVALYCVFALVELGRIILHVRSGGAYGSFLLPVSVVVFVYAWLEPFARTLPDDAARQAARRIVLSLLLVSAIATAVVLGYRYRRANTVRVSTDRGTLIAARDTGTAWNAALAFIDAHTAPGDDVAVLPEGVSLVFLSGRRNPLREEIVTPGFLDDAGERRAISALGRTGTRIVMIVNRATREFGAEAFGRDYDQRLMQWIAAHYRLCATFGAQDPALQIGDPPFFVRAYCRD